MIAPRQIGWSEKANLLWEISRQLDRAIAVLCTGPCPTTTSTTTAALCNYLYEGVLTVGQNGNSIGYAEFNFGSIIPLSSSLTELFWDSDKNKLGLVFLTEECYSTMDVYINETKYTLLNVGGNSFSLVVSSNPFPPIEDTCIIQICPGDFC
jgi:hypothetical protein